MTDEQKETVETICAEMFHDIRTLDRCGCKFVSTERVNEWRLRIKAAHDLEVSKIKDAARDALPEIYNALKGLVEHLEIAEAVAEWDSSDKQLEPLMEAASAALRRAEEMEADND